MWVCLVHEGKDTILAGEYAKLYLKEIVRMYGVPLFIILDRYTQFISHFGKALQSRLGTKLKLIITFHPQTDGLAERIIKTL